jgi:hypothetical protein
MHNHTRNENSREHFAIDQPTTLGGKFGGSPAPQGTVLGGRNPQAQFLRMSWAVKQWINWNKMNTQEKIKHGLGCLCVIIAIILLIKWCMSGHKIGSPKQYAKVHYEFF